MADIFPNLMKKLILQLLGKHLTIFKIFNIELWSNPVIPLLEVYSRERSHIHTKTYTLFLKAKNCPNTRFVVNWMSKIWYIYITLSGSQKEQPTDICTNKDGFQKHNSK